MNQETTYRDTANIPGEISIYDDVNSPYIHGLIIVNNDNSLGIVIDNEPDILNLGNFARTQNFNFQSSNSAVGDSGYAVIWSGRVTDEDNPYTMTTYYGVQNPPSEAMDRLISTQVITGYNTVTRTQEVVVGWRMEEANDDLFIQTGANADQHMQMKLCDARAFALGVDRLEVDPRFRAEATLLKLIAADSVVSGYRARFGTYENRLEYAMGTNAVSHENLSAAESRIRDTDMAKEMMQFTKANVLQQASVAMLAQANQQPQAVLQLLR